MPFSCSLLVVRLGLLAIDELRRSGEFSDMSLQTDEDEHSIEMHLPYIRKVFQGSVRLSVRPLVFVWRPHHRLTTDLARTFRTITHAPHMCPYVLTAKISNSCPSWSGVSRQTKKRISANSWRPT